MSEEAKVLVTTVDQFVAAVANPTGVITLDADLDGVDTVEVNKSCTIDLNGHKMTAVKKTALKVSGSGVVCTINGEADGSKVHGTIIVGWKDGDGATLNVKGGMYVAAVADEPAIQTNGTCQNITINIEDAYCESTDDTFYLAAGGVSNFKNCSIYGATGLYVKGSKISLVDCAVYANGEAHDPVPNGNGASSTGDAIIIDAKKGYTGEVELTVDKDSELFSENRNAVCETYTDAEATVARKISLQGYINGPVTASDYFKVAIDSGKAVVNLDGGSFTADVSDNFLPEGQAMYKNIDGSYSCRSEETGTYETFFMDDAALTQLKAQIDEIPFVSESGAERLNQLTKVVQDIATIDTVKGDLKPTLSILNKVLDIFNTVSESITEDELESLKNKALQVYFILYRAIETQGKMK